MWLLLEPIVSNEMTNSFAVGFEKSSAHLNRLQIAMNSFFDQAECDQCTNCLHQVGFSFSIFTSRAAEFTGVHGPQFARKGCARKEEQELKVPAIQAVSI
jgi:hypothetical protein